MKSIWNRKKAKYLYDIFTKIFKWEGKNLKSEKFIKSITLFLANENSLLASALIQLM